MSSAEFTDIVFAVEEKNGLRVPGDKTGLHLQFAAQISGLPQFVPDFATFLAAIAEVPIRNERPIPIINLGDYINEVIIPFASKAQLAA